MTTRTTYTEADIAEAVELYAEFHAIDIAAVDVSRNFEGAAIIGFRLSRDADGGPSGDDETTGEF